MQVRSRQSFGIVTTPLIKTGLFPSPLRPLTLIRWKVGQRVPTVLVRCLAIKPRARLFRFPLLAESLAVIFVRFNLELPRFAHIYDMYRAKALPHSSTLHSTRSGTSVSCSVLFIILRQICEFFFGAWILALGILASLNPCH